MTDSLTSSHSNARHDLPPPVVERPLSPGERAVLLAACGAATPVTVGIDGRVALTARTDHPRLAEWTTRNWPGRHRSSSAELFMLAGPPTAYGIEAESEFARFWCPSTRTLYYFRADSYAIAKVSVRGLASAVADPGTLMAHGCSLLVRTATGTRGALVVGSSGAGKTSVVSALKRIAPDLSVVNDDWGPVDLDAGMAVSTGESALHVKFTSLRAFRPDITLADVAGLPAEGTPALDDPSYRLLVPPESMFGAAHLAAKCAIDALIVVSRSESGGVRVSPLTLEDLATGAHSPYYRRHERFFNGSLFECCDLAGEQAKWARLLDRVSIARHVTNGGTVRELADAVAELLVR